MPPANSRQAVPIGPDAAEQLVWSTADLVERAPNRHLAAIVAEASFRAAQMTLEALKSPAKALPLIAPPSPASAVVRATVEQGSHEELTRLATALRRVEQQLATIERTLGALQGSSAPTDRADVQTAVRELATQVSELGNPKRRKSRRPRTKEDLLSA